MLSGVLLAWLAGSTPAVADEHHSWCFPSGLRVGYERRESGSAFGAVMVVDGGAAAEADNEVGAAHVVEHLWFRADQERYGDVTGLLAHAGAEANASTTHDVTTFETVAHKASVRSLLALEAERLANPLAGVSDDEIEVDKAIVVQELLQRYDGTEGGLGALLRHLFPASHPYSRPISGLPDDVKRLDRAELEAYVERQYRPENASLFLAGTLKAGSLLTMLMQIFPDELLGFEPDDVDRRPEECLPRRSGRAPFDDPPQQREIPVVEAAVSDATTVIGWSLPAGTELARHGELAAEMLDYELIVNQGSGIKCWALPLERGTVLGCEAESDDASQMVQTVDAARSRLWRQAVANNNASYEWNEIAKVLLRQARLDDFAEREQLSTSSNGHLVRSAQHFHRTRQARRSFLGGGTYREAREAIEAISEFTTTERMRAVQLVPPATAVAAAANLHQRRGEAIEPQPELLIDESLLRRSAAWPDVEDLHHRRLPNGLELFVLPVPGNLVQEVQLQLRARPDLLDEPALSEAAFLYVQQPRYGDDPAVRSFWGGEHYQNAYSDADGWDFWYQGTDADLGVELLSSLAVRPIPVDRRRYLRNAGGRVDAYQEYGATAMGRALLAQWDRLAPGVPHPYIGEHAATVLGEMTKKEAREYASPVLRPDNAVLVVAGKLRSVDDVERAVKEGFARWPKGPRDEQPAGVAAPEPAPGIDVFAADVARPNAFIDYDCHVAGRHDLVDAMIEHVLQQELDDRLRNDMAATYGVSASIENFEFGPGLHIELEVPHDAAGESVAIIRSALDRLASGEVDEGEMARLRLAVVRSSVVRFQATSAIAQWLVDSALSGQPPQERDPVAELLEITPETLAAAVAPCSGSTAAIVVGDVGRVSVALDAAGIDHETED